MYTPLDHIFLQFPHKIPLIFSIMHVRYLFLYSFRDVLSVCGNVRTRNIEYSVVENLAVSRSLVPIYCLWVMTIWCLVVSAKNEL